MISGKDVRLKREGAIGCPGKINLESIIIPSIVNFLRIDHFL